MNTTFLGDDPRFLKSTIASLREEVDQLHMLQDISRQLLYLHDHDQIVACFLDIVKEMISYNFCILYLFSEDLKTFRVAAHRDVPPRILDRFNPDEEVIWWVLNQGRWTHLALPQKSESDDEHFYSVLPLQGAQRNLGFLLIATQTTPHSIPQSIMNRLSHIAGQAALALENQRLYEELRHSNNYIKNIIESINNGIIIIDMADCITQLNKNATAMLGLPSADIIGARYQSAFSTELSDMIGSVKQRALRDGFSFEKLFEYAPVKDLKVPLGVNASLLFDDNAERIGVIIVFRNMFVLKELDRLRQLDELKSELVSNVSHELRSPLSVIRAYSDAILNQVGADDHETRNEFLSIINDEADRLTALVNDLLDISRIESGSFEIDKERVQLRDVMEQLADRMATKNPLHRFVCEIPDDLPVLWADRDKLLQVFLNLLDNAIKFSPAGGDIDIRVTQSSDHVQCAISDPGIGIAEEHLPYLYDKFYRVDNSDVYEIPGTGLGLPIVKHIVESHGGHMDIESCPDRGSTFSVRLPFIDDSEKETTP